MENDTITAIASGLTASGIGIIRVSGEQAFMLADRAMHISGEKSLTLAPANIIRYGYVYDEEGPVDEVLAMVMKAPHSYTGEDVVEIQCHGGPYIMKRILDRMMGLGARLAQPGEFTKRAFLNGRLDLSQAEAVMELIDSESESARRAALAGLRGELGSAVSSMREKLIYETAYLEAALDDPEHISLEGFGERLSGIIDPIIAELDRLIDRADNGRVMRDGIRTVILGRPNAGKSTLLNMFTGQERAIVTSVPGTTRDTLEERIRIGELSLVLVDTAGLRTAGDEVEGIGIRRAREAAAGADLILYMIDGTGAMEPEDREELQLLSGKPVIILINKSDEGQAFTEKQCHDKLGHVCISVSAREGTGRDRLEDEIRKLFYSEEIRHEDMEAIANTRQKEALCDARASLIMVRQAIDDMIPEDLWTVDLMDAYTSLGRVTGQSVRDDLVDEIFSKFCMGK